jgi:uncharacterized protein (TIGR00645 family)
MVMEDDGMSETDRPKSEALRAVEFTLYAGRLLLVPMALGLLLGIAALLYNFIGQAILVAQLQIFDSSPEEGQLIIEIIRLIDYFLLSGLMIMVAVNGYDFFISHIYVRGRKDTPDWVGAMGIHGLKMNLFITICAISSFQLLQIFFDIVTDAELDEEMQSLLPWLFGLHGLFLATAVVIALLARFLSHSPD